MKRIHVLILALMAVSFLVNCAKVPVSVSGTVTRSQTIAQRACMVGVFKTEAGAANFDTTDLVSEYAKEQRTMFVGVAAVTFSISAFDELKSGEKKVYYLGAFVDENNNYDFNAGDTYKTAEFECSKNDPSPEVNLVLDLTK